MSTHGHRSNGTSVATKPRGQQKGPGGHFWEWSSKQPDREPAQLPAALKKRLEEIFGHVADALAQPRPIYPQITAYRAWSQHQAGIFVTAGTNHRKAAQCKVEIGFGSTNGQYGLGPHVTLLIWGLNASALNSLFASTGGDLNRLARQVAKKCDLSVPVEQASAPADTPICLNEHTNGTEHRDEGVSLAAAGPSVVLQNPPVETPVCVKSQASTELRPDEQLSTTQAAVIRIIAASHGIFNGQDFKRDALASVLEDASPPIENAAALIDAMTAWGHLASDGARLRITAQGYEFCFGGPSTASN